MTAEGREPATGGWLASAPVRWLVDVVGKHSEAIVFGAKLGAALPVLARVPRGLRPLAPGVRLVALACLLLLAVLAGATYLFDGAPELFARLTWSEGGRDHAVPRPALYLALAGWAVSAAVVVAAAAHGGAAIFVAVGLVQVFAVAFAAFPAGKAYVLAGPSWVLAVLAATTAAPGRSRRVRTAATVALCGLATWHTYLLTPLSAGGRPPRWTELTALFVLSVPVLLILPRRLGMAGAFLLALAVNATVLLQALRAGEPALARGLVLPASFLVGLFSVMWFALGGELVSGAVSAANVALKVATRTVRRPFLGAAVVALCAAEFVAAPWLLDTVDAQSALALALALHRWVALALAVLGGALAARGGLTPEGTRFLLATWIFGLAALRAYFSEATDLAAYAGSPETEVGFALTLFTAAIVTQAVLLLIEAPAPSARERAAPLLLQIGALLFLATGTTFQFAAGDTGVMREAAAYQFAGATALFLPLLLALLIREQRWLPAPPPALLAHAFVAGFAAAFAVQLLRMATVGPGGWTLAGHLGAVALGEAVKAGCIAAFVAAGRARRPLETAAAAIACALGFAAGYAQNLAVLLLDAAGKIVMLLTVRSAAVNEALAALVAGYVRMRPEVPAADHYHLAVASLLPAAVTAWGVTAALRDRRAAAGGLAIVAGAAISIASAWALHAHPLLMAESREPVAFYAVFTDPGALLLLAAPVLGLAGWLYVTVWRAGAPAGSGSDPEPTRASAVAHSRQSKTSVGVGAVALPALALAVAGVAVAMRAEAPMDRYLDPAGRFTIDHPRGWRIEARAGAETRLYRDDPDHGPLVMAHPGIALPRPVSEAELLSWLERQIRAAYPDVRLAASAGPPRLEAGASVQRIELAAAWTSPQQRRLRSKTTITLVSTATGARFSYVTYQLPEAAPASEEATLARIARSYRPR